MPATMQPQSQETGSTDGQEIEQSAFRIARALQAPSVHFQGGVGSAGVAIGAGEIE